MYSGKLSDRKSLNSNDVGLSSAHFTAANSRAPAPVPTSPPPRRREDGEDDDE